VTKPERGGGGDPADGVGMAENSSSAEETDAGQDAGAQTGRVPAARKGN